MPWIAAPSSGARKPSTKSEAEWPILNFDATWRARPRSGYSLPLRLALLAPFNCQSPEALKARMSKFQCLSTLVAELNRLEYRLFLANVMVWTSDNRGRRLIRR
jgi:hypothetical protein